MSAGPSSFLPFFSKLLGFAIVVIGAFVGGTYWSASPGGCRPLPDATEDISPSGRIVLPTPEPEDFFPVSEFRQQSALLLGAYDRLQTNPELYLEIARAIDGRLPLFGLVNSEGAATAARDLFRRAGMPDGSMHFVPLSANTIWIRDYAPFLVRREDNSIFMIDAKYQSRHSREIRMRDEEMANALADLLGLRIRSIPLVIEGGNFLSNGDGTIFTTSKMIALNKEFRFNEEILGDLLSDYFGVRRWIYSSPLDTEPTGHLDMYAALLAKNIAVVGQIDPLEDAENSRRLDVSAEYISKVVTSIGPMQVFRIPMPPKSGEFWRSYTNIILANGILLMPSFSDVDPALERQAEETYRKLLPAWEIKKINCDALVTGEGQLHCMSYNLPKYVPIDGLLRKAGVDPAKTQAAPKKLPVVLPTKS